MILITLVGRFQARLPQLQRMVLRAEIASFTGLRLPAELDFAALFHGVDERVPVDALEFGTRVLDRLLRSC